MDFTSCKVPHQNMPQTAWLVSFAQTQWVRYFFNVFNIKFLFICRELCGTFMQPKMLTKSENVFERSVAILHCVQRASVKCCRLPQIIVILTGFLILIRERLSFAYFMLLD